MSDRRRADLRSQRSPQSWSQESRGPITKKISIALGRWSHATKGRVPKPPRNWGGQLSAGCCATAFQVSPATEMLLPPPPEAVTAVRGRDSLHQLSSQPPEGKGKVRNSSGSSWHSGHQCPHQGLGRERGLRECQGSLTGEWTRGGHANQLDGNSGCLSLKLSSNNQ